MPATPLFLAPAAFLAGLLMFLAPCTLPLVPGYIAFISGSPRGAHARAKLVSNALAFVLGFSLIFILLGTFAAALGSLLGPWRADIARAAGIILIVFGLTMIGVIRPPLLASERRMHLPNFIAVGRWESSLLLGTLFALGWSPCIGPILGSVLLYASTSATALQGALLLGVFSLGLGIPFVATALLLETAGRFFAKGGRATALLSSGGGIFLVVFGVAVLMGDMGTITGWGYTLLDRLGYNGLLHYF